MLRASRSILFKLKGYFVLFCEKSAIKLNLIVWILKSAIRLANGESNRIQRF